MLTLKEYGNIGEKVYTETLPNGLRICVIPKTGWSKSYAFFATNYGGADRRFKIGGSWIDTPAGVAHFLEHKMFDTPDGGNALTQLSANGASPNAFTSSGITGYHYESTQAFYENLKTLLSFVSIPYFTQPSVDKEQGIIGQEIRMVEDSPGFVLYYEFLKCLYENHPIRESVAGTIESIAQIKAETLYDCHKIFYNPSNMTLCVMGDADPEKVSQIAGEILPAEAGEVPERDYGPEENGAPLKARSYHSMEVSLPLFIFGSHIDLAGDGWSRLRQKLVAELSIRCILGKASPLYLGLYSDGLLSSPFDAEFDSSCGLGMAIVSGESIDPEKVLARFCEQVKETSENGLNAEYFERVKKADYGFRIRGLGSFNNVCISMAEGVFSGYSPLDAFELLEGIEKSDCESFISTHFAEDRLAMSVVEPKK